MAHPDFPADGVPPTVLLVDDDDELRKTLVAALKRSGYRVLGADSAERGLQLAESSRSAVAVALLDINLPDSWGAQLVPGLRLNHPDVQVIYTSGYAASDPILRAAIDGDVPFLHKPFEVEELLALVEERLDAGAGAE